MEGISRRSALVKLAQTTVVLGAAASFWEQLRAAESTRVPGYHTGGVPGRGEVDAQQEINYSAVMSTILDAWFDPPRPNPLALLN